ncbi:MAG: hypothetical protein Q9164_007726, partial [Protoblastenia rupestris]
FPAAPKDLPPSDAASIAGASQAEDVYKSALVLDSRKDSSVDLTSIEGRSNAEETAAHGAFEQSELEGSENGSKSIGETPPLYSDDDAVPNLNKSGNVESKAGEFGLELPGREERRLKEDEIQNANFEAEFSTIRSSRDRPSEEAYNGKQSPSNYADRLYINELISYIEKKMKGDDLKERPKQIERLWAAIHDETVVHRIIRELSEMKTMVPLSKLMQKFYLPKILSITGKDFLVQTAKSLGTKKSSRERLINTWLVHGKLFGRIAAIEDVGASLLTFCALYLRDNE